MNDVKENINENITKKSLLPTNDVIFHCLFGQVGSEKITKELIQQILNEEIDEIDLDLNLNLMREKYDSKLGILDVRARTAKGTNYNIEMQNTSSTVLPERILSYWSRLYSGDLKKGNDYDTLCKTIAILIVNETIDRFDMIEKFHSKWNIREEDYKDIILTDDLEIHIIELPKYKQKKKQGEYSNIWLDFIIEPEAKEVLKAMYSNEMIKEAKTKWKKITADDRIRDRPLRLEIAQLDRNTEIKHAAIRGEEIGEERGRKIGEERGQKNKSIEIAQKLKQKSMPIEEIMQVTGLTEDEVKNC